MLIFWKLSKQPLNEFLQTSFMILMYNRIMTRTYRRRDTKFPTRDGDHNPVCRDPKCVDCK